MSENSCLSNFQDKSGDAVLSISNDGAFVSSGFFKYLKHKDSSSSFEENPFLYSFSPILNEMVLYGHRGEFHIKPTEGEVNVERPLWCAHDIFFFYNKNQWLISDDMTAMTAMQAKLKSNPGFIANYLSSTEFATDQTPFTGIGCVMPGTTAILHSNGQITYTLICGETSQLDSNEIPETLIEHINSAGGPNRPFILELSGGLDSSGVFYAALTQPRTAEQLYPVTYYDPNISNSTDVVAAQALCGKHGVNLHLIPIRSDGIFTDLFTGPAYKPKRPSLWLLHSSSQRDLIDYAQSLPTDCMILNGHGGDHIFLSNPVASAIIDHLWKKHPNITKAFETARKLTVLNQKSWLRLARESLSDCQARLYFHIYGAANIGSSQDKKAIFNSELYRIAFNEQKRVNSIFQNQSVSSDWIRHRRSLMAAVHHGAADRLTDIRYQTVYPYLNETLIRWAENRSDSSTFSYELNRLPQRESFHRRFGATSFMRKGKGDISGIVQRMIRAESEHIVELILNGEAAKCGFINKANVLDDIRRCQLGGEFISPSTLLLLSLELYYKCWKSEM